MFRVQCAGLELDAFEAIGLDHAPGLSDDLFLVQCFAPAVWRVGRVDVLRVLEEQVGAERDLITNRAAEQVHQRQVHRTRLHIQKGHFER